MSSSERWSSYGGSGGDGKAAAGAGRGDRDPRVDVLQKLLVRQRRSLWGEIEKKLVRGAGSEGVWFVSVVMFLDSPQMCLLFSLLVS